MKIRTKISLLVLTLIAAVVASIVGNLIWVEQRRVRSEFSGRVNALMEGVLRIARESLTTQDELMLLSYLKFLMKDYPEIEMAIISRQGHTSLIGEVKTELFYRTLTITERTAAAFKALPKAKDAVLGPRGPGAADAAREPFSSRAVPAASPAAGAASTGRGPEAEKVSLPPDTFTIQLGFSKTRLDRQTRLAQAALAFKILAIAGVGLLLGLAGSLWLGRLLARPVIDMAVAAQKIGEGKLDTVVDARGRDEIGELGSQFNRMAGRLRELIGFKEDLFGTLSHELNTPLSGLKGFLEYLQESKQAQDPADRLESYQTMSEAVRQMEISLSNALQLFKSDSRPVLHLEPLDINGVLGEVLRLFAPMAQSNGVALRGPQESSEVTLAADREMMRRVFINLVSNGLKYTPPGGTVTITLREDADNIVIRVADTGPGIAPVDQERIFTKFYRAPGPDGKSQRIPGSGLGLAIAKQAVELQKGRIWVESKVGSGSIFHVRIPKGLGGLNGTQEKA